MSARSNLANLPPFIRWYIEAAGEYKAPQIFHYWCALSLLAAFSSKNYWYEHIRNRPLYPNLYVGLLGPSARGKGLAIGNAMGLVHPHLVHEGKNYGIEYPFLFNGSVTSKGMVSLLTTLSKKIDGGSPELFLVCPELGESLDMPANCVSGFVRKMTSVYDNTGVPWSDMTRMYGFEHAPSSYLNWLFGTTTEWLHDAIPDIDYKGGFAGRILPVMPPPRDEFLYRPRYPQQAEEYRRYLQTHLELVRVGGGPFTMTGEAEKNDEMWCRQRFHNPPGDERMLPFTERGDALVKKLAMLFSLARNTERRIEVGDIVCAQQAVNAIEFDLPAVLDLVFTNDQTRAKAAMKELIREHKRVPRSMVMRYLARQFGLSRKDVLELEATLKFERAIDVEFKTDEYLWLS